ncbi:MAG TPA: branched-chain amino acid ABC transporter permease [Candidatus Methylomirabilis sp.]|nr:branched-chain amino acid ABC transporter permease [Candidatus Methylomirabilis sp.]HSC71361.1 branched-chain amino acid ABC transporter permease [Candidatus Methylomirabilis sp.]
MVTRQGPRNGALYAAPAAALLLLLVLPGFVRDEYYLHVLVGILFFAYMASAWNIVCGYTGQLSLGHSALCGIGGYVSTLLLINLGLTPWIGMLVGGVCATVAGVLIGYPCFRLRGPYFALTTIAFAEILRIWAENTEEILGIELRGAQGISVPLRGHSPWLFQFGSKVHYYYIIIGMLLLVMAITYWMERSRVGFYLKAIRADQDAAEALGINSTRHLLTAMALSSFLTALGGSFYAQYFRYINPERNLGLDLSIEVALMGIVGGQGTVLGPVLGAFLLTPAGEISRATLGGKFPGLHLVIYGLVLVVAVLFLPKGLIHPIRQFLGRGPAGTTPK